MAVPFRKIHPREEAQGLVEYILIIALVALVAVAAVRFFGSKIQQWFQGSAEKLEQEMNANQ